MNPKQTRDDHLQKLADMAGRLPRMSEKELDRTLEVHCRSAWQLSNRVAREYIETAKMMIGYIAPNVPESGQTKLPE